MKLWILIMAGMMMAGGLAGCMEKEKIAPSGAITRPLEFLVTDMDQEMVIGEEDYDVFPLFAPVLKLTNKLMFNLTPGDIVGDVSLFSSQLATAYYGQNSESTSKPIVISMTVTVSAGSTGADAQVSVNMSFEWTKGKKVPAGGAIIVDSYENALLAGPLASVLNAPILYYGSTTNEALWRIGAIQHETIVVLGRINEYQQAKHLRTQEEIINFTIEVAKSRGVSLDYISVANPYDDEDIKSFYEDNSKAPYTEHLSSFASLFAVMRSGIVITTEANPEAIDKNIEATAQKLKENGMEPKYLLMLGDSISLPFVYYWILGYEDLGMIPTDNIYAYLGPETINYNQTDSSQGFPENASIPSLANGRIVAKNLRCLYDYFNRILNYESFLAAKKAPSQPLPLMGEEWNNNALAYSSTAAEFGAPEEVEGWMMLFNEGRFNAQEDTAFGHLGVPVGGFPNPSGIILAEEFTKANLIIAGADHGCPHGNSVWYDKLLPMPPNVNFQVSCLTGMIDMHYPDEFWNKVSKDDSFTYTMLEKGVACYVAAMRSTFGTIPSSQPAIGKTTGSAGDLAYYFMEALIKDNCTVGQALKEAKAKLYADPNIPTDEYLTRGNNNRVFVERFEYQLYGDPAFNPYEPCNEGKSL